MQSLRQRSVRLFRDEGGGESSEYVVLLGLAAAVLAAIAATVGNTIFVRFGDLTTRLGGLR